MTSEEMQNTLENYAERLDRHLEIYANNGKELKSLGDRVSRIEERFVQQISGLGSDIRDMKHKIEDVLAYKKTTQGWINTIIETILKAVLIAILVSIGLNLK